MPEDIETTEEVKRGSRHSASDNQHLRNAIEEIRQAGGSHELFPVAEEPTEIPLVPEKTVVTFGGEVKALPDGKIGGYLVTFGGVDLTGDYFTTDTDFGEYTRLPVLYHHGFDDKLKTRRIGTAEVHKDDVGLWAEAQLNLRDEYEQMVFELAKNGKLGWSSGAAAHVVAREEDAKGMHITQWYMAEASLTPTPAEPRNSVIPLKSFLSDTATPSSEGVPEAVQTAESEDKAHAEVSTQPPQGDCKMAIEITPEIKTLLGEVALDAVKQFAASAPAKPADVVIEKDEAEQPWGNAGEFFMAVKNAALYPNQMDRRLLPLKSTGLNEAVPSQGGFLVSPQFAPGIMEKVYNTGTVLSLFNRIAVTGNSMTWNVLDESSRAEGSRYGGLQGYWVAEGGSKTASKPAFKQLELKLKKLCVLLYATDELLEDQSALQGWINNTVPNELRFMAEDAIVAGNGVGKPLGILSSPALISVTRNDAGEIDSDDIASMWARRYVGFNDYVWLANPQVIGQLLSLTVGQVPVYLPAGGFSGLGYSTLLGRPYYDVEYCPTLGEIGDIILFSPSAYAVIEKAGGIQAASSPHVAFTTNEMAFRFEMRIDGAPTWASSLTGHDAVTYSPFVSLTTST